MVEIEIRNEIKVKSMLNQQLIQNTLQLMIKMRIRIKS